MDVKYEILILKLLEARFSSWHNAMTAEDSFSSLEHAE